MLTIASKQVIPAINAKLDILEKDFQGIKDLITEDSPNILFVEYDNLESNISYLRELLAGAMTYDTVNINSYTAQYIGV